MLTEKVSRPKPKIRMYYRREIPRLNRDKILAWQELMRLHLATISDLACKYLDEEYQTPTRTLSVADIDEKKSHNIMMIDIVSALSNVEFDEIKDYKSTYTMWNKIKEIFGGDDNVK